jgi:hypothetical protein
MLDDNELVFIETTSPDEDGFAFGATPKLTTTLKRLVRSYPKDVGIIKEFIQNADDAGARFVKIIMDWRRHPSTKLPDPKMQVLMGPALLIFNNAIFSDEDLISIQNIGESVKLVDTSKIGRFGLGFNATYNVTDYPSLLTRNNILFFDPHLNVIPGANYQNPGRGWNLTEKKVWEAYADMLNPFKVLDSWFVDEQNYFNGTLFRLPLRTDETYQDSQIKQEPFTEGDFNFILDQLKQVGAELLLFLKNVTQITVSEIIPGGVLPNHILSITTENEPAVLEHRKKINKALSDNPEMLLNKLRLGDHNLPKVSYTHSIKVEYEGCIEFQEWRIVSGLYVDNQGEIPKITETMVSQKEKAFPWAGCAARLQIVRNGSNIDDKLEGQVYCLLPLGIPTGLPVHINGVFDLSEDRKMLTSGEFRGSDENRVKWNKLLVKHCISRSYTSLIKYLAENLGIANINKYYDYWPDPAINLPPALRELVINVYQSLQNLKVLSSAAEEKWKTIHELVFLQKPEPKLLEALMTEKFPFPDPVLPIPIKDGFELSGVKLQYIKPKWVRDKYRIYHQLQCSIEDAPRPSLQKQELVEALLKYCLRDSPGQDLKGLPLALLSDGRLHTFGYFQHVVYIATETERKLFANKPDWFIDPIFAKTCGLITQIPEVNLISMTVEDVISNFSEVIPPDSDPIDWQPSNEEYPNEEWLITLYQYLVDQKDVGNKENTLKSIPLVPDQFSRLWKMGNTTTPLLIPAEIKPNLLDSLKLLELPLVTGSAELVKTIEEFERLFSKKYIWEISGIDLIDLLDANAYKWREKAKEYDKKILEPILDFLSDERFIDGYLPPTIGKLKKLPILITEDGKIIEPELKNIFIPAGQKPPPVAGEICLVRTGQNDRWRKLIRRLGIQELDRPALIKRIISGYDQLSDSKKVEALRWIRMNLETAEEQVEKDQSREAAVNLRKQVAEASLVICQEGELVPICRIYDPNVDMIKRVLGKRAYLPDLDVYKQGERQWLEFFEKLGMEKSPRAADILDYIDSLITEAEEHGAYKVASMIMELYDHIKDNWDDLARQEVQYGFSSITFQSALHNRAWLPARTTEEMLSQFPGYVIPEDRLYKASELQLHQNGRIIASQCPISLITIMPPTKIREGLGFPDQPSTDDVLNHFDVLLLQWNGLDHSGIKEAELEASLHLIYEFIGVQFENDQNSIVVRKLRNNFQNKPCIWDFLNKSKTGKGFWLPHQTFKDNIPYLSPFRIQINHRSKIEGYGFDALGRKAFPIANDYCDLLVEILSTFSGEKVEPTIVDTVIYSLEQLTSFSLDPDEDLSDLPVITQDGYVVEASDVYEFDAPWWEGKIFPDQIHLLDNRVPLIIREISKIKQLSKFVTEKPLEKPTPVILPEITQHCNNLQEILRSSEFRQGFERIIKHNHSLADNAELRLLNRLSTVTIIPVERIKTQLILQEGGKIIGKNDGDCFYLEETNDIFVIAKNKDDLELFPEFLANSLNEQLGRYTLSDLSPLVKIINLSPGKIDATLTRLRIRQLKYQEVIYSSKEELVEEELLNTDEKTDDDIQSPKIDEDKFETTELPVEFASTEFENESEVTASDVFDAPEVSQSQSQEENQIKPPWHRRERVSSRRRTEGSKILEQSFERTSQARQDNISETPIEGEVSEGGAISKGDLKSGKVGRRPRRKQLYRSSKMHLAISRVFSEKHRGKLNLLESLNDESPYNREVGDAAEKRVLDWEISAGCEVEKMPKNNTGFDIISVTPDGNIVKYIEVKGVDGPWTEDGVSLTPSQFIFSQRYEELSSEQFWLYVVEYARDDEKCRIYPILNPTGQVTQFRFDSGWRELATNYEKPLEPEVGMKIQFKDGRIGTITQVIGEGPMKKLDVVYDDGKEERIKFRRSIMTLLKPEE